MINVISNPLVILAVLGMSAAQGLLAAIGFWTVDFMELTLHGEKEKVSAAYGIMTVIGVFTGTIMGGQLLDRIGKYYGGKSVAQAFGIAVAGAALTVPLSFASYQFTQTPTVFLVLLCTSFLTLMIGAAGYAPGVLWLVAPQYRMFVSGLNVIVFNLLGSVPAPLVVGLLKDKFSTMDNPFPREIMSLFCLWMLWSVFLWGIVGVLAKRWGVGTNVDQEGQNVARIGDLTSRLSQSTSFSESLGRTWSVGMWSTDTMFTM